MAGHGHRGRHAALQLMFVSSVFMCHALWAESPPREFAFSPLPQQPSGVPWPTERWPRGELAVGDRPLLKEKLATLVSPGDSEILGTTHALTIVHRGELVFEYYDSFNACDKPAHTMSIAKMLGAVMAGIQVRKGALILDQPAAITEWQKPAAPRRAITIRQILSMTSGLEWNDSGLWGNDFIEFAFGSGIGDLSGYTAGKPLAHQPGTHFQYSDGSLSLLGRIVRDQVGGDRAAMIHFLETELFAPLGMNNSEAEFDRLGVWYGSSGMRWSPCDWMRFSYLLLRDGLWNEQRILPAGYVDQMRTPTAVSMEATPYEREFSGYGLASMVFGIEGSEPPGIDAFGHSGFRGHVLRIVPSRDLIIGLMGSGSSDQGVLLRSEMVKALAELFPKVDGG